MERYSLSSGRPDRMKTTTVVGMVVGKSLYMDSTRRANQLREATSKITGLHQKSGEGPKTRIVFMGWNSVVVNKAAEGHATKEANELQAVKDEQEESEDELESFIRTISILSSERKVLRAPRHIRPLAAILSTSRKSKSSGRKMRMI
jgi:hypothetical protein